MPLTLPCALLTHDVFAVGVHCGQLAGVAADCAVPPSILGGGNGKVGGFQV